MKLTICGATGATGTCLVQQALAAGHEVTAVVRDPARLAEGTYRTAIDHGLPHSFHISRADLAACMLTQLDDPATTHRQVVIAN